MSNEYPLIDVYTMITTAVGRCFAGLDTIHPMPVLSWLDVLCALAMFTITYWTVERINDSNKSDN